jgi:2-dehydropantoate 2-reductase
MGAGAIGSYVGGMLAATGDADVVLVGRSWLRDEIAACGLTVRAFGGAGRVVDADRIAVDTEPGALAGCDAVLCCVKSAHTADAARALAGVVAPGAVVASLQNGLRNADALRAELSDRRVVAGIVGFNVVAPGGGAFQRTTARSCWRPVTSRAGAASWTRWPAPGWTSPSAPTSSRTNGPSC